MMDIATTICNKDILPKISTKEYGNNALLVSALDILNMVRAFVADNPCENYKADVRNGLLYINGTFIERIVPMPKDCSVFSEEADYYENRILAQSGL